MKFEKMVTAFSNFKNPIKATHGLQTNIYVFTETKNTLIEIPNMYVATCSLKDKDLYQICENLHRALH